jgi:hypothetical protein
MVNNRDDDFETLKQIALTIARRSEEHEERMDALERKTDEIRRTNDLIQVEIESMRARNQADHAEIVELIAQNQLILDYLFGQQRRNGES